jgi:hypothetical protein
VRERRFRAGFLAFYCKRAACLGSNQGLEDDSKYGAARRRIGWRAFLIFAPQGEILEI